METVQSKDGTLIAFDRSGNGPSVILVGGAFSVRSHPTVTQLVERLAPHFTVYNYDRRGRGDSGDTAPYAVEREVEDIEALVVAAGGSASVFGTSSGAVLALEAASRLPVSVTKVALYEPPFILDDSRPPLPEDYVERLNTLVAEERRGDAVEYFMMAAIGLPAEFIPEMREDPSWSEMEEVAHTLAYDGTIMGETMSGKPLPGERVEQWAAATMPTLVMVGEESEPFFHHAAQALADSLPNARRRVLEGQTHDVAIEVLAPVLVEFLT